MADKQAVNLIAELYQACFSQEVTTFMSWELCKLREVVDFDGAIYGAGSLYAGRYHDVTLIELDENFPEALQDSITDSVLLPHLLMNIGRPANSAETLSDEEFFASGFYKKVLKPRDIHRVLAISFADTQNGLYSHISLYRKQKDAPFSKKDTEIFGEVAPHIPRAYRQAYFFQARLRAEADQSTAASALCDAFGVLHDVDDFFGAMMSEAFPGWTGPLLPAEVVARLKKKATDGRVGDHMLDVQAYGDLFLLSLRNRKLTDELSEREREVVDFVSSGLSYKEIGLQLGIATATVSTLLYRAYLKLGVHRRSELVELLKEQKSA